MQALFQHASRLRTPRMVHESSKHAHKQLRMYACTKTHKPYSSCAHAIAHAHAYIHIIRDNHAQIPPPEISATWVVPCTFLSQSARTTTRTPSEYPSNVARLGADCTRPSIASSTKLSVVLMKCFILFHLFPLTLFSLLLIFFTMYGTSVFGEAFAERWCNGNFPVDATLRC